MTDVLSRRDVDFLLYEWLDVVALTSRKRFADHSKDTFDAVLDLSADLVHTYFAPHNKTADAHEPSMRPDGTVEMIPEARAATSTKVSVWPPLFLHPRTAQGRSATRPRGQR